jgi:hypothetical protein
MNRPIARRALFLASIVVALAVAATVFALVAGQSRAALGIACGAGVALVCGLSWIVGALLTFDGPLERFLKATLALAPVRFFLALIAIGGVGYYFRESVDMIALACSFVAGHVLFTILEVDTFRRLTDASSPYPPAKPARFGPVRFW